ncbi:DUF177 domain-containing protein [Synechococcus sp. PCC 6717]|nr:DUF177 domain-containing protein [Synechococcus sp. PCC 6716]MCI3280613.1 DUF177 domain-containing protein [Synechococcus sp. PCC 6717]
MAEHHWLSIPDLLRLPDHTYEWQVSAQWPEFATLTPVQGVVSVSHRQTYLEVSANVGTIMTLCCDRCLQYYNHRLVCTTTELIWLADTAAVPDANVVDDLVESLPATGRIDLVDWLYQQLCLALPHPQYCDPQCGGIMPPATGEAITDHRWAALAQLQSALERSDPPS